MADSEQQGTWRARLRATWPAYESEKATREKFAKESAKYTLAERIAIYENVQAKDREQLAQAIQDGKAVVARDAAEPTYRHAQQVIDELVEKTPSLRGKPVTLYVHIAASAPAREGEFQPIEYAAASQSDRIEIGQALLEHACKTPAHLRVLMAHELGHTVNHDCTPEESARRAVRPRGQRNEILANRAGAIIYGNVDEFNALLPRFVNTVNTYTHPGTEKLVLQGQRWSAALKRHGVADTEGNITDHDGAMAIHHRYTYINPTTDVSRGPRG